VTVPVVGLIGCGFIGRFHSRNIRAAFASGAVEGRYAVVCDRDTGRAEAFAAITGARVAPDAAALFETAGLTAVYICTETAEHPALVLEAARRGLAVFCEKPLARRLAEVEEMVAAVAAAGVVNQVGLVLRYSPVFTVLRHLMQQPGLGPLLTAHLRDDQCFPVRGHYASTWRGEFERAGGGTLIEHSIHDIDLFRWLFGEVAAVRCHTRVTSGHPGVEDVALVTFQHTGGQVTTLSSVWHDLEERGSTRRLEVFFEGAYFATDDDFIGPIRCIYRHGPPVELGAEEVVRLYCEIAGLDAAELELARAGMMEDVAFLRCVAADLPASPDFGTALAAHRVVAACYESAKEGREIALGA